MKENTIVSNYVHSNLSFIQVTVCLFQKIQKREMGKKV